MKPEKDPDITLEEAIRLLRTDIPEWNSLRMKYPEWHPSLFSLHRGYKPYSKSQRRGRMGVGSKGIDLSHADLRNANLSNAWLTRCNFDSACLVGADLHQAFVVGATFRNTDLSDATLWTMLAPQADFSDAKLHNADLTYALVYHSRFHRTDFSRANLSHVHFSDRFAKGADLTNAVLTGATFSKPGDFQFPFLAGALGLETVTFDTPSFLSNYLCDALACLDGHDVVFLRSIERKIRSLTTLLVTSTPPLIVVSDLHTLNTGMIRSLAQDPKLLHDISPRHFEELVAELLASFGWNVTLTAQSRDGGYDIFGISKDASGLRTSWIIECKKWSKTRKVGVEVVRGLYAVKQDLRVSSALLATTSHYSSDVERVRASR